MSPSDNEPQLQVATSTPSDRSAAEKAQAFESWARNHAATPLLSDDAIRRENLIRDARTADCIRELRKGNLLPEGVTIRDLINEGRGKGRASRP